MFTCAGLGKRFLPTSLHVARLRVATAAVSNHHAYPGGLLRHTVDLMEIWPVSRPAISPDGYRIVAVRRVPA